MVSKTRLLCVWITALALDATAPLSSAQNLGVSGLISEPAVRRALDHARTSESDTLRDQVRLCEIPAPPFAESARADAYAQAMRDAGLADVRIDRTGNVLGERRGRSPKPHLVLSAHLDTVFPADVPVSVTRDNKWLRGPGIGDDCRGLAVVLAVARALITGGVQTEGSITFVGTVGEEGLGDLRGVRSLLASILRDRNARFVSVESGGHTITNAGLGSRRYRVTFRGPGGHSYEDFGRANPVNAVGAAVTSLTRLELPASPRTTLSVGRVGGGTSVNSIATEAWMEVDVRSADKTALDQVEASIRAAVRRALDDENGRRKAGDPLTLAIETVGNRPAGRTEIGTPVVDTAIAALKALSLPVRFGQASTDANLPMSVGIPSIAIGGGGISRDAHTPRESFDTTDSWKGTQLVTLLAIALSR